MLGRRYDKALQAKGVVRVRMRPAPQTVSVVPTYRRWVPYKDVLPSCQNDPVDGTLPFIINMTLRVLHEQRVPKKAVHIWVANKREYSYYRRALRATPRSLHAVLGNWSTAALRIGVPGLAPQRAFISKAYAEGTHIVSLDDDLRSLQVVYHYAGKKHLKSAPANSLLKLVAHASTLMQSESAFIWGVNVSQNPFHYHRSYVSRKANMIGGPLFGYRNRHDARFQATHDALEDVERSLAHAFWDRCMLRFRMFGVCTQYGLYNGVKQNVAGGLQDSLKDRLAAHNQAIARLARLWDELGHIDSESPTKFVIKSTGPAPLVLNIFK